MSLNIKNIFVEFNYNKIVNGSYLSQTLSSSVFYKGLLAYNKLNIEIKALKNIKQFKVRVKESLCS